MISEGSVISTGTQAFGIVEKIMAQRASKNRPKGSPITKNNSMTRGVYTKMLREQVFPAIR
jgi:hypothetical protein